MKIVYYVIGFIAFCLLGFLAIGLLFPTVKYETEVVINRPKSKSWTMFIDEKHTKDWLLGYHHMELIEGKPKTPGAKFKMVYHNDDKEITMIETTNEWKDLELFSFTIDNPMMEMHSTIHFSEPAVNQTLIHTITEVKGRNVFFRALLVFMKETFQTTEKENFDRLKNLVESEVGEKY